MANILVTCHLGSSTRLLDIKYDPKDTTSEDLRMEIASQLGLPCDAFYLTQNGKVLSSCSPVFREVPLSMVPRLLGGKGGFGSMLRAIGAQIEKTTNREACRDLSGRRLRDINEEQRLKRWFAKQKEREEEKEELKKKKLEKLRHFCEGAPLPLIDDIEYNRQRAEMADSVFEAVDKGFETALASESSLMASSSNSSNTTPVLDDDSSSTSNSSSNESKGDQPGPSSSVAKVDESKKETKQTLKRTFFEEDLDSDISESDSDEDTTPKKAKLTEVDEAAAV